MYNEETVIINDREAVIFYRISKSEHKDDPSLYTHDVEKVLSELLKGGNAVLGKGLNTLGTLTSFDEPRLNVKRISNKIVELRKVIPKNGLITFRYIEDEEWRYGLVRDPEVIAFAEELLALIRNKLV